MHPDEQKQIETMMRNSFFPGDHAVQGMFDALMEMSKIGAGVAYMLSVQEENPHAHVRITQYEDGFRVFHSGIACFPPKPSLLESIDSALSMTREIHDQGGL